MRNLLCAVAVVIAFVSFAAPASADVVTFDGGILGTPVLSTVEGNFRYDTFSGSLFLGGPGNPGASIQGTVSTGGGVLSIVRDDVLGGRFTFDQLDVFQRTNGTGVGRPIEIRGFLNGVSQAVDIAIASSTNDLFSTFVANALSGVTIDELRISISANPLGQVPSFFEGVDNATLTPIPEPAGLALLAIGVAAVAVRRRRSR